MPDKNLNKLRRVQSRAARIVCGTCLKSLQLHSFFAGTLSLVSFNTATLGQKTTAAVLEVNLIDNGCSTIRKEYLSPISKSLSVYLCVRLLFFVFILTRLSCYRFKQLGLKSVTKPVRSLSKLFAAWRKKSAKWASDNKKNKCQLSHMDPRDGLRNFHLAPRGMVTRRNNREWQSEWNIARRCTSTMYSARAPPLPLQRQVSCPRHRQRGNAKLGVFCGKGGWGPRPVEATAATPFDTLADRQGVEFAKQANVSLHRHQVRAAGEGRRVVAPPRSTARPQSSPVGRVESFRSWSSHLFRRRPAGRRHVRSGGRLSDTLMWSWRAMFAGVLSSSRATCPNTERYVDGIGDETVKSDRSVVVTHHFGLGRTIGFQAAVSSPTRNTLQFAFSKCNWLMWLNKGGG